MSLYLLGADGLAWVVWDGDRLSPTQARAHAKRLDRYAPGWPEGEYDHRRARQLRDLADRADAAIYYPTMPETPTRRITL